MHKFLGREVVRTASMLSCTSALALALAAPALAASAPAPSPVGGNLPTPLPDSAASLVATIQPVSGDVSALYGRINPFYGDIASSYGRINPFSGDVESSYGRINPFYGRINPFYGRINPFFGDVSGFYGRINPFTQTTDTATATFYGKDFDAFWGSSNPYKSSSGSIAYSQIAGFWSTEFAAWNVILPQWNNAATAADAKAVAGLIQTKLLDPAVRFWAPFALKMGKSAATTASLTFAHLAEAGVTFNADGSINSSSLLNSTPSERAMLLLNVYDQLMDFAGTGHADWWMGRTGWSPALAETQGKIPAGGTTPTIGLIDFALAITTDSKGKPGPHISKQIVQYGSAVFADGHGAAVGSLIIGATDGSGVLGVLPPGAGKVVVYDPYDDTNTTNWDDVGKGLATLTSTIFDGKTAPLGVLNASLGVPGWTLNPGWNDALKNAGAHDHNLVIAAGNDGVTQTENVSWNFAANPTILVVGSIGADGTISNFSNTPGEACLLRDGSSICSEADKLKYRFLVAPGELILVSDGLGGHMRQSGTSLAAPLVSGAIALLQNRWPWLSRYPEETASIILKSATPRGDQPGADSLYGAGELNIAASQAPLRWDNLVYYQATNGKVGTAALSLSNVVAQLKTGTQSSWDSAGLAFTALEKIGGTHRDFQIPLSSKLVGQTLTTAAGGQAYQSFLASALRGQAGRFASMATAGVVTGSPVNGFVASTAPVGRIGEATLRMSVTPVELSNAFRMTTNRYEAHAALVSDAGSVQFGIGQGAAALDGTAGFGYRSDYELGKGGANPLLGLASGGGYLGGSANVAPGLSVTIGTTGRNSRRNLAALGLERARAGSWIDRYAAEAQTIAVAYRLTDGLTARASLTRLHEKSALLGVQSVDRTDLLGGTTTAGTTMGFDLALGRGLMLSGTGTLARSRAASGQISTRDLTSASTALAIAKAGLFARTDEVRLTLASPMHAIGGRIAYSSVGVIDRDTGELGVLTQTVAPRRQVPLATQLSYGMALPNRRGEFSLLGRVDRGGDLARQDGRLGYTAGAQVQFAF